ncbi:TetR family transcriptional regulator [Kineococcus sp. T13]|uniref:TetR/AcrR family transcriptional regulator n=1 Tax=Kineococcus vitellinus TaxID=2696565 RepID=UPI0014135EE6|nr:TetR/AcrR family transcriptional regulator [Kineococcus vitellinus]NAZ75485.1 TetR family transcriptional regulator [Kineococcus vitellinus]
MDAALPLVERKQKAARQRIVVAAARLFAERGFDGVSVSDIAESAEVGRTTFFRHFGDKQEVVFAREQELLDALTDENLDDVAPRGRGLRDGLSALQPLVLRLCAHVSADPEAYRQHEQLVEANVELRARSAAKMQLIAGRLGQLLVDRGWEGPVGFLAAQIALACYWTARASGEGPEALVESTAAAFRQVLAL